MEGRRKRLILLSVLAFLMMGTTGCRYLNTPMQAGDYAYELNGFTVKVAKVMQTGTGWDMRWADASGNWLPVTEPVQVLTKRQLGQLVTGPVDRVQGLQSTEVTILFVPYGWTQTTLGHNGAKNTEFKCNSGYVWWGGPLGPWCLKRL